MMRRKAFLPMGIAAAMLMSSCGGADAPSSLPPSSVEVMEGSSPSPSVVPVAEDQYYNGVLKVQETTEKGLSDYELRWMLGSPVCGEAGCTWAWEDVTGEWTISGSLTINADGSVSGTAVGWWGFGCDGEQRMSSVELSGSATPSAIGSAPTSLSLTVVEEGANPGTCGPMRNVYEFDATGGSSTPAEQVSTPAEGQTSPEPTATEPAAMGQTATGVANVDTCTMAWSSSVGFYNLRCTVVLDDPPITLRRQKIPVKYLDESGTLTVTPRHGLVRVEVSRLSEQDPWAVTGVFDG